MAAQGVHTVEPVELLKVPGAHGLHVAFVKPELYDLLAVAFVKFVKPERLNTFVKPERYDPASQPTQPTVAFLYVCPGGHD